MQPLISVIVPVYNVSDYLSRCVESILNQTHQELEIILVNDGSIDDSGTICDDFALKDKRVKVIHQENAGVSGARNAGLDITKGEWIGFADPDDWIEPDMFEKLLGAVNNIDSNSIDGNSIGGNSAAVTKIAICGFVKHCIDGRLDDRRCPEIPVKLSQIEAFEFMFHSRYFEWSCWNKLFNHKLLENIRFDLSLLNGQDSVFVTEVLLNCEKVAYVPETLYHYCSRKGSAMESFSSRRLTELTAWEQVLETIPKLETIPEIETTPKTSNNSKKTAKLVHRARICYVAAALGQIRDAAQYNGEEFLPLLKKKARQHVASYFLSKEIDLRMKFRCTVLICIPKLSHRVWQILKQRFRITWWHKELRGGVL